MQYPVHLLPLKKISIFISLKKQTNEIEDNFLA
jgi:hypothetical protein